MIDYERMYQLCIVHMNARSNECVGLSTGARLGYNFTAKSKGSNPQSIFTAVVHIDASCRLCSHEYQDDECCCLYDTVKEVAA